MPDAGYVSDIKDAARHAEDLGNSLEAAIGFPDATDQERTFRQQVGTIQNALLDRVKQLESGGGSPDASAEGGQGGSQPNASEQGSQGEEEGDESQANRQ